MSHDCCRRRMAYKYSKEDATVDTYEPAGPYLQEVCLHGRTFYAQTPDMKQCGGDAPRRGPGSVLWR